MYTEDDKKKMKVAQAFFKLTKKRRKDQTFSMKYEYGPQCYYHNSDCCFRDKCQYGVFCKLKIKDLNRKCVKN